jgi:hypothetical protein
MLAFQFWERMTELFCPAVIVKKLARVNPATAVMQRVTIKIFARSEVFEDR